MFAVDVGQSSDFEAFGDFQQRPDLLLADVDLPFVHELHDSLQFGPFDVLQNDNRVLAGVVEEQTLEIWTARRQNHFVGFDAVSVAGQRDVDEALALQKLIENVSQIALVIIPSEAKLLRRGGRPASGARVHFEHTRIFPKKKILFLAKKHAKKYRIKLKKYDKTKNNREFYELFKLIFLAAKKTLFPVDRIRA